MTQILETVGGINLDDFGASMPLPEDISTEDLREHTGELVLAQRVDETGNRLVIPGHPKVILDLENPDPKKRARTENVLAAVLPPHIGRLSLSASEIVTISPDPTEGDVAPDVVFPLSSLRRGEYTLRLIRSLPVVEESAA